VVGITVGITKAQLVIVDNQIITIGIILYCNVISALCI